MLTKPGAGIWRTGGAFGSPIHTLFRARTADTQSHPASGMPTDTVGMPPPWQSRSETDEASWGTAVGPPSYTTHWGLLKQPDNQKPTTSPEAGLAGKLLLDALPQQLESRILSVDHSTFPVFAGNKEQAIIALEFEPSDIVDAAPIRFA